MVRKPMTDKCEVECLFEYHFHNALTHTCDYHKEQDMLCIGNSRGQIINYDIRVEPDCSQLDFRAKARVRFQVQGPEKVVDRDTKQSGAQAMVIIKPFVQYESRLPVFKANENGGDSNQKVVEYFPEGSSDGDDCFDDDSDAESDGAKKTTAADGDGEPKEKKLQVELYRTGVINCHTKKVKKVCIH